MIDEQKLTKAFDDFDAAAKGKAGAAAAAAAASPCATWQNIRGTVGIIITGLTAIGTFFPIAARAATVLTTLKGLLDSLCGIPAGS